MHVLAGERRLVLAPQRLHGEHVLAGHGPPVGEGDAVVADLVLVPPNPTPSATCPPVRHEVEVATALAVTIGSLGREHDPGAEPERRRGRGGGGEADQRVERPLVLLVAPERGAAATGGDVRVLGQPQRVEARSSTARASSTTPIDRSVTNMVTPAATISPRLSVWSLRSAPAGPGRIRALACF